MILLYTNKEDTHPTNVIKYLNEWGVPVFRLNTECILTDYEFEWWCDDRGVDFHITNIKNNLELYGHQVTAIWDRRALVPTELPITSEHDEINRHNLDEARGFLAFLRYYTKDIFSIGSIVEDRPADSKMLQLRVARSLGMPTPDTSFANTREAILNFSRKYEYISLKSIVDSGLFLGGDKEYVFFSQRIKSSELEKQPIEAFNQTVSFVQNYIDKKYELRITVVCDDVIACKIDSQLQSEDTGKIDWRQGYEHDLKHEIVDVPEFVADFCRKFLKRMKLNFGCFDFIVTPDDKYVFLECNPNGQWLWIELVTNYDISHVIAENLAKVERAKQ
ncbi:MAG: hypothetical protein J6T48_09090 [Bacteroidales bacterium]|nr:hypothetical protein [Bacteroidales bacterium]